MVAPLHLVISCCEVEITEASSGTLFGYELGTRTYLLHLFLILLFKSSTKFNNYPRLPVQKSEGIYISFFYLFVFKIAKTLFFLLVFESSLFAY
jgi:hypothetical protein